MSQFLQVLFYLGALQGLMLSIFLFTVKNNRLANRLLGLLTLFWALILVLFPLQEKGLYSKFPHLINTLPNLLFTFFPLLYLHVKQLLSDLNKFEKKDFLHFIPFIINIIIYIPFFILSGEEKIEYYLSDRLFDKIVDIIGEEVIAIQGIVYSALIFRRLNKYSKEVENYQSSINKTTIKVLYVGTALFLLSWLIGTVAIHLNYFNIDVQVDLFIYVYLILVLIIYFISFMSIRSPEMYKLQEITFSNHGAKKNEATEEEYKNPEEIEEESRKNKQLLEDLERFMLSEKPYLDSNLGLIELARQMDMHRNQLSRLINQEFQMNFYEFINMYRVDEVKSLMKMPENQNLKIISIAYDAGFNSKSSFNRIFKQHTNMTPSEFLKSIQE